MADTSDAPKPDCGGPFSTVPIELTVSVGRARPLIRDLLALGEDAILPLDTRVDDPVELFVGDRLVARGELQELEGEEAGQLAVRITEIADAESRYSDAPAHISHPHAGGPLCGRGWAPPGPGVQPVSWRWGLPVWAFGSVDSADNCFEYCSRPCHHGDLLSLSGHSTLHTAPSDRPATIAAQHASRKPRNVFDILHHGACVHTGLDRRH